jgi:hypothetical protein
MNAWDSRVQCKIYFILIKIRILKNNIFPYDHQGLKNIDSPFAKYSH